jgi:alcohol dehydrogenase class IV
MDFEFAAPARIVFGPGSASRLAGLAATLGSRTLVVTGADPGRHAEVLAALHGAGLSPVVYPVSGEPTVEVAASGAARARESACDLVVSVGGGGALDAGKAVAALMTNTDHVYEYLEVVGKARPITNRPAPHVALPTTAGTGAEATANAVLTAKAERVKVSLRSPMMLPTLALVDPLLTLTVPPVITAATGLDALTQLLEAFTSNKANPMTDALCRQGLSRAARSIRRVFDDGSDAAAREDMALASLFSGIALANAKLGAVHGFAAPLGGLFGAPHGQVCAALLPHVTRANIRALTERAPQSPALDAYAEAARMLTGNVSATAGDCAAWVESLCAHFSTPPLSRLGVTRQDIPLIVDKASRASSMKGNPIELTAGELSAILEAALA